MTIKNKDKIRALLKSIETGDPEPVAFVNEARYIQHNPQTHEGSEGLASLFKRLARPVRGSTWYGPSKTATSFSDTRNMILPAGR